MKSLLLIPTLLLSLTILADEFTVQPDRIEETKGLATPVVENGEESAEEVRAASTEGADYNSSRSNKTAAKMKGNDETHTPFPTSKAPRDAASGMPTGKRQHKPLTAVDPDSTENGVEKAIQEVCNSVDQDCDLIQK